MDDVVNILMELGLNKYESAALSVLLTKGSSTPSDISKSGSIPRPRVYDILDSLAKTGLCYAIPGRPKRYAPVSKDKIIQHFKDEIIARTNHLLDNLDKLISDSHTVSSSGVSTHVLKKQAFLNYISDDVANVSFVVANPDDHINSLISKFKDAKVYVSSDDIARSIEKMNVSIAGMANSKVNMCFFDNSIALMHGDDVVVINHPDVADTIFMASVGAVR